MGEITLGGFPLDGEDQYGVWRVNSLEGWWEQPDRKIYDTARPFQDGDYDLPSYFGPRVVTISGSLNAKGHDQLHHGLERLAAFREGNLIVQGHGEPLWARTKNIGYRYEPVTDRFARWQFTVKATDPRKFGEKNEFTTTGAATSENSVRVLHRGNAAAYPVVTVTGSSTHYTLFVGDKGTWVETPLVAGQTHVLDFWAGTLTVGGQRNGGFVFANFVPILPGNGERMWVRIANGSATARIKLLDTYI